MPHKGLLAQPATATEHCQAFCHLSITTRQAVLVLQAAPQGIIFRRLLVVDSVSSVLHHAQLAVLRPATAQTALPRNIYMAHNVLQRAPTDIMVTLS